MKFTSTISLLVSSAALAASYTPEAVLDQVINLPGAEKLDLNFKQFSGYLKIGDAGSKNMHYWMVESMNNPATDPIAFWTNGGPGCSGLLGFLTEQGPLRPNVDMSLSLNPYAWNQRANMVFIEQPCGVGFSYSDNEDDYSTGDAQAAADNYLLLQAFFSRFPEYSKNDLYITSESYGGHYMPTLAKEIVDRNKEGLNPILNFKGFALGNPQITVQSAMPAGIETYWGHQLVAKPMYDNYRLNCATPGSINATLCETIFMGIFLSIEHNFNAYALDYPVCTSDSPAKYGRNQRQWLMRHMLGASSPEFKNALGLEPDSSYEPCADDYMTTYLNQAVVKAALHVKDSIVWADCSRTIRYSQTDSFHSMVPVINYLIGSGNKLNLLVYSGDDDGVCPTVGTQDWIWSMDGANYDVAGQPWQPYKVAGQTAGFITKFKNTKFSFMTVRGAGHEVPTYKPEVALWMWNNYLDGTLTNA